jgi:small subunit ribosomal protein S4
MPSRVLEKVERRLGEKLLLKGERCAGPKCAVVRRSGPPGVHGGGKKAGGKGGRRRNASEYGVLLREKQKVRFMYGLDDREMERYSKEAAQRRGIYSENFLPLLEGRIDNTVFRLGLAESRRVARMMVTHGHITVNGKRVSTPSYRVKKGNIIAVRVGSLPSLLFAGLEARLKKIQVPHWLSLDPAKKAGTVAGIPVAEDILFSIDIPKIKEFYSR